MVCRLLAVPGRGCGLEFDGRFGETNGIAKDRRPEKMKFYTGTGSWRWQRCSVFRCCLFALLLIFASGQHLSAGEPHIPERIVSLAPHITEIVFKLGAGDRLVGRTEFCRYPAAALDIESVGGYLNVDYEKIVSLQPDAVLQFPNAETRKKLELLGFKVVDIPNETIEEILSGIHKTGASLGLADRAEAVCRGIRDTLSLIRAQKDSLPGIRTFLLVGREPGKLRGLYAAGKKTYLSEILQICGGQNVFADVGVRYFGVNTEDVLSRDIRLILEFQANPGLSAREQQAEISVWQALPGIPAVRNQAVYLLTNPGFLTPGPRITRIAKELAAIIKQVRMRQGER